MKDKQPSPMVNGIPTPLAVADECPTCKVIRESYSGFGPSHMGSPNCESGSIASGGTIAHCTCDTCF